MTTPIADDFAAIAARLRELEGKRPPPLQCWTCFDSGYIARGGERGPIYTTCPTCLNPNYLAPP
jgi:hypothetical protein